MIVRRIRQISTLAVAGGLLVLMVAAPAAAADCVLSAPTTVDIGSDLAIEGSGFPANAAVDVSISIEGGASDDLAVQSNASGAFTINLTPESADEGVTTVVATSGADCRAEVVIGVGVPAPASQTGGEAAGEAAGEAGGAGAGAPRTDGVSGGPTNGGRPLVLWLVAGALIGLGIGGRYASRPSRSR